MRPSPTRDELLELLKHFPEGLTYAEMAAETGRTIYNIWGVVRHDKKRNGADHFRVVRYEPTRNRGGKPQPVFVLGPGEDIPPPKNNTKAATLARKKRYREKHKARIRANDRVRRGTTTINPFAGLL